MWSPKLPIGATHLQRLSGSTTAAPASRSKSAGEAKGCEGHAACQAFPRAGACRWTPRGVNPPEFNRNAIEHGRHWATKNERSPCERGIPCDRLHRHTGPQNRKRPTVMIEARKIPKVLAYGSISRQIRMLSSLMAPIYSKTTACRRACITCSKNSKH